MLEVTIKIKVQFVGIIQTNKNKTFILLIPIKRFTEHLININ